MWKDFLYYTKTERQGIIVLVVLILGVYAAPKLFSFFTHAEDTDCRENEKFDKEYNDFISSLRETQPHQKSGHSFQSSPQREIKLAVFDPNIADSTTFLSLGLPSWMIKNILHYRYKQGKFRHPEDFRKIYGLTEEQYQTLRPYIQITEDFSSTNKDTVRLLTTPSIQRDTPGDLVACSKACEQGTDISNWRENYPDYLGCCHSLDYNVGRLVDTLKKQGMWENTILVYTADHGSHFLTRGREAEYKRTCHDASIHIPLIITGPGFTAGIAYVCYLILSLFFSS